MRLPRAGHLWAAHRVGARIEPVRLVERAPRLRSLSARDADLLTAVGPLALAAGVETDACEFLGSATTSGQDFGTEMLASWADFDPLLLSAPAGQHRRSQTYPHHVLEWVDRDDYCLRGGDSRARSALSDLVWLDAVLPDLLSQWCGVGRLARRLLAGAVLTGPEVADLLTDLGRPR